MSKNCASLSVYRRSSIVTWIKDVSFLALCLLSPTISSFHLLPGRSLVYPSVDHCSSFHPQPSTAGPWSLPCHRNGYILPKPLHCLLLSCFSRTRGSWPCSLEHCLSLTCVFAGGIFLGPDACFFFFLWPFIDDLQGSVLNVLSSYLGFSTWGDEYLSPNMFSMKSPFHPSVMPPFCYLLYLRITSFLH